MREFTKDIPKAKVLCARDVMSAHVPEGDVRVMESDTVETIEPLLLSGIDGPTDSGRQKPSDKTLQT